MSLMLDEHRQYLSDRIRTSLFRRAIGAVIEPGDVVLDLACGTGVLGLLAMKAGAARLYQVDVTPMIQVARDLARADVDLRSDGTNAGTPSWRSRSRGYCARGYARPQRMVRRRTGAGHKHDQFALRQTADQPARRVPAD